MSYPPGKEPIKEVLREGQQDFFTASRLSCEQVEMQLFQRRVKASGDKQMLPRPRKITSSVALTPGSSWLLVSAQRTPIGPKVLQPRVNLNLKSAALQGEITSH